MTKHDQSHGGPYDRGTADSYLGRYPQPHYYIGGTVQGEFVEKDRMTKLEIEAYWAGYDDNEIAGNFKDW